MNYVQKPNDTVFLSLETKLLINYAARKANQNKKIEKRLQVLDCNTDCMELYLQKLSEEFPNDQILLVSDGASWHKANDLYNPGNIHLFFIPPGTPEMNPIEQIWKEIRKMGFRNEIFSFLADVVDRLCWLQRETLLC